MYSALKRNGRPLYELARQGVEVARAARPITIESLALTSRPTGGGTRAIDIEVVCSKGTYIRVLAEEIAAGLGTRGHLGALRRVWVDPFAGSAMVTLEEIASDAAQPRPAHAAEALRMSKRRGSSATLAAGTATPRGEAPARA